MRMNLWQITTEKWKKEIYHLSFEFEVLNKTNLSLSFSILEIDERLEKTRRNEFFFMLFFSYRKFIQKVCGFAEFELSELHCSSSACFISNNTISKYFFLFSCLFNALDLLLICHQFKFVDKVFAWMKSNVVSRVVNHREISFHSDLKFAETLLHSKHDGHLHWCVCRSQSWTRAMKTKIRVTWPQFKVFQKCLKKHRRKKNNEKSIWIYHLVDKCVTQSVAMTTVARKVTKYSQVSSIPYRAL